MASLNSPTQTAVASQMTAMDIKKDEEFVIHGPTEPSLQNLTIGKLLQQQIDQHPDKLAVVSRWQNATLTYQSLFDSSLDISQALLAHGLFLGVGGLGSVFTIINSTFTAEEVLSTIDFIGWACFF
ncbi:Nonribosomal peptide synthetases (NRPS) [Penicillium malachiteum]|uniref:Nonribosomal peptide synthetases (NRPS) n=1 Tax=Penicillium malachiteum TaxID=1324776 RepID=UPI002549B51B|nr:Nonribosomal peptide synthetases (NRPS) [Penicillium malachiteum]KAJ5737066.1 Nonribosomal peptide synthetases (NRPS) [Penicillium malachiteum]